MQLTLDSGQGRFQIVSYEPGKVKINDQIYTTSLIVSPNVLLQPWRPQSLLELRAEDFAVVLEQKPEVVLLGTGAQLSFPPAAILQPFAQARIGVEVMDTAAACRTFDVLTAEGRQVVAALLL